MYSDKRELWESLRSKELMGYEVHVLWPKDITCLLIKIGIRVVFIIFNFVDNSFLTTS
jgi:hypothetical protein